MAIQNSDYSFADQPAIFLMEQAYRYCGIPPVTLDYEHQKAALFALNTLLTEWANQGILQFNQTISVVKLEPEKPTYAMPPQIYKLMQAGLYELQRQSIGAPVSSSGNAALAFDGSLTTACTQTAPNGYLGMTFTAPVMVNMVGVLSNVVRDYQLVVEWSNDNINWIPVYTAPRASTYPAYKDSNSTVWLQLTTPQLARFWRIREIDGHTLDIAELYLMRYERSLLINPSSRYSYFTRPNKNQTAQPSSYTIQKTNDQMLVTLWPVPTSSMGYTHLVIMSEQYPLDVNWLRFPLNIQRRFFPAILLNLAHELAHFYAPDKVPMLKERAFIAFQKAVEEDADQGAFELSLQNKPS